jgi:hypothetical protein
LLRICSLGDKLVFNDRVGDADAAAHADGGGSRFGCGEYGDRCVVFNPAAPVYAGLSPGSVGLYQVNVTIPEGAPPGNVDIKIMFPDGTLGNPMQIAVQ